MPVAPDVCHGSKPWHFQDVERVIPMTWVHQPPVAAWIQSDPLPEPWVSCVSNVTSFLACFVTPSRPLLPPLCLPSSFIDVEGNPLATMEQHM
jgi:hypothetical protein